MLEGGKISNRQLLLMLVYTVLGTAYFFLPSISASYAGRDFWLCPAFMIIPGLIITLVITKLHSLYPGLTIIQYGEKILGKIPGKVFGILIIFWIAHTNSIIIQELGNFLTISFMPRTPTLIFTAIITFLCGLTVYYGLELVARAAEFLFPIVFGLALVLLMLAAQNISTDMITPVLSNGILPVLAGAVPPMGWIGEVVLASMLIPYVDKTKSTRKTLTYAVLIIAFLLTLNSLEVAGVFGEETGRLVFPVNNLARQIDIFEFLQRMEVILIFVWIAGIFVKVSVFYYCATLALAQLTGLNSYRPVIIPLGVLLVTFASYNFRNVMELASFISLVWPFYGFTFEILFPSLLLVVSFLRREVRSN